MDAFYPPESRSLQDRFDTRRLADRLEERLVHDRIEPSEQAFIESRDLFFLASVDADGQPSCSYKGGDAGFVRVVDPFTLVFPNYDGNGMFLSMGNILARRRVGLLFIDFESPKRLRVSGEATIEEAASDAPAEAQFIVRVRVTRVFPNCPRYVHRYRRVDASEFVPRAGCATPVPKWKRTSWAADVLPARDPARGDSDPERSDRS